MSHTHATIGNLPMNTAFCGVQVGCPLPKGEMPTCPKCLAMLGRQGGLDGSIARAAYVDHMNAILPSGSLDVEMIPPATIGRIVHYQSFGTPKGEYQSRARAAIVTQLNEDGTVGLCILNPTGMFFTPSVKFSHEPEAGCWSWPPRV